MQSSLLGIEVAGYRIEEKLGEGGMGTVYRALETNLGRRVALKLLHPGLARDPSIVERFRSEARAQANLNHPNVTTLHAFVLQDDHAMIAMEYIQGETLRDVVKRRGPIPASEALGLFRQVLAGVGAAHRVGIIHRDIKPSNLMLNEFGIVKVMDFGIAKVAGNNALTRTGLHLGTLYYMSPEQVKGEAVDVRSDIYSLGITLYQMVTARVPFEGDSEFKIMSDHVNTTPPLPTSLCPAVPEPVERAILKALQKNPADRFQSVEEFAAALSCELGGQLAEAPSLAPAEEIVATTGTSNDRQETPTANSRPKWRWIGVAAAVMLIAAGTATYVTLRPKAQTPALRKAATAPELHAGIPAPTPIPSPLALTASSTAPPAQHSSTEHATSGSEKAPVPRAGTEEAATSGSKSPLSAAALPPTALQTIIIPAGTLLQVHIVDQLDAASARPGQAFTGVLDKPVSVGGTLAIPAGTLAKGEIASISREGMLHHSSKLLLALTGLVIRGSAYPIQTPDAELPIPERPSKLLGRIGSEVSGFGRDIRDKVDDKNGATSPDAASGSTQTAPGEHFAFQLSQPLSIELR